MNQPHHPDPELSSLAEAFDNVLHSLSTQNPAQHDLSDPLTSVAELTARLSSTIRDAHTALATCAPAARSSHAATATDLCLAIGAAGRAVNALATAQDAHLFIDHFADRYGNPDDAAAFARTRIAAALTKARDNLTETRGYLRHVNDAGDQLQRAACARSSHAPTAGPAGSMSAITPAPTPPGVGPATVKGR
ncbi:hypothetical protein ACFO3J_27395 [Streptomyces polygonati]|uniref:Uncharacterized protein n=1 Tax=Streptomyces polygonati TaxID=1617087 RepID=A0ABV8HSX0_9ACTN